MFTFYISYVYVINVYIDNKFSSYQNINGSMEVLLNADMERKIHFNHCVKEIKKILSKQIFAKYGKDFLKDSIVITFFKKLEED
jgi:hypothetical protein